MLCLPEPGSTFARDSIGASWEELEVSRCSCAGFPRDSEGTLSSTKFSLNSCCQSGRSHADLFSVTLRDDDVQEFDTRWDEVPLPMSRIPSDDVLESLYKLRIRESDQLKTVSELYDTGIHQKISMPNYQKLKTMVKRSYRSETQIAKLWRQTRENRDKSSEQESKGIKWRWWRKKSLLPMERKTAVFGGIPVQFPAWEWRVCTKTDTESRHTFWAINDMR